MFDGLTVDPKRLSAIKGLAFRPVLPAWHRMPTLAQVTSPATSDSAGRRVVLRYHFTDDPDFPSDGRIVVEEGILVGKPSNLNGLAQPHQGITMSKLTLRPGVVGLLLQSGSRASLELAKGNAIISVDGPAVSEKAARRLAATF